MSQDIRPINAAIGDTLTGSAPLMAAATNGVWNGLAPDGTAGPYVVFDYVDDIPAYGLRGSDTVTPWTFLVKGISDKSGPSEADELAALIDAALHSATLSVSGYGFVRVRRRGGLRSPLPEGGWQSGAYYEVVLTN